MKNELSIENLKSKYKNVPIELQNMKRWVCYKVEGMENGKTTKRPYNAMNGSLFRTFTFPLECLVCKIDFYAKIFEQNIP